MKSGVSKTEDKIIQVGKSGILTMVVTMAVTVNGTNRTKKGQTEQEKVASDLHCCTSIHYKNEKWCERGSRQKNSQRKKVDVL
jgi:hypothetical protein